MIWGLHSLRNFGFFNGVYEVAWSPNRYMDCHLDEACGPGMLAGLEQ